MAILSSAWKANGGTMRLTIRAEQRPQVVFSALGWNLQAAVPSVQAHRSKGLHYLWHL